MDILIPFLIVTTLVALSVPGVVVAVRALPPVQRLVDRGVKPWACDICSCFWITALLVFGLAAAVALLGADRWWIALAVAPPAYTLSLLLLRVVQAPHSAPPMPDLE